MRIHNLTNTRYFSEAAVDFTRNKGFYTKAPVGSREYVEYWEEQEKRCRDGYSVGGLWIPGRYYFYLNFSIMSKVPDEVALKAYNERKDIHGRISTRTAQKIIDFPRFWEPQYEWHMFKHIAWSGGEFMGVKSPGGKHIGCLKARGGGFSYMAASSGTYNYNFIPYSKTYYFAGREDYLNKDGILNKVQPNLDWINQHIFEWKQNRQKHDTIMYQKASYLDAGGVEQGNMSEIIGVVVNDPDKTRGKRGVEIDFEEGGSFNNLKRALNVSAGSIRDGDMYVGQQVVFGTGGEEGPDIEGLEEVFDSPDTFDMIEFPNIWEGADLIDTACGYFCPAYRVDNSSIDADGNVDIELAISLAKKKRKQKKKSNDPLMYDQHIAEYPWNPQEALKRIANNPFLSAECNRQVRHIKNSPFIQSILRYGYMTLKDGKPVFVVQTKDEARPIEDYPHKRSDDLKGCVTVVEQPYVDKDGKVPDGLYEVVFDMYAIEEAEDETSLAYIGVVKNYNNLTPVNEGVPVAWFRGRPQDLNDVYQCLVLLCRWYNAQAQGEIGGGGQGLVNYCRTTRELDLLEREPEMMHNKDYASQGRQGGYLMNMSTEKKKLGLTYLVDWHKQIRTIQESGEKVRTIHRWYDIVGLMEMAKFNGKRNADTISAGIIWTIMLKEAVYKKDDDEQIREKETDSFFNREMFTDTEEYGNVVSLG